MNGAPSNTLGVPAPTLHDDEGYLSPSEEDLKSSVSGHTSFLNCKSNSDSSGFKTKPQTVADEDDSIAWEIVATMAYTREDHLSWDRLKLPVPYRFQDKHQSCLRQMRTAPSVSYVTDSSSAKLPVVLENVWRSYNFTDNAFEPNDGNEKLQDECGKNAALAALHSGMDSPVYISVSQYIQQIFHLLCGRESLSFSIKPGQKFSFTKNPLILVHSVSPSLIMNVSKPYINCGRIFKKLSHMSALHYDENLMAREGLQCNAVLVAILKFISDYLKLYQTSLMLKAPTIHSFTNLRIFSKAFQQQLETLEFILDTYLKTDQITLLKGLNTMMLCCEFPHAADLLRSIFTACSTAYLEYVSEWIFRGVLTKGFHIQRAKASTYTDRRYWVKQFYHIPSVPTFLESSLILIFETGKAINLLNMIRDTEPKSSLMSSILHNEGSVILPVIGFSEVNSLQAGWKTKVDSFFEEFSFLQTDIDAALSTTAVKENKRGFVDFSVIEEIKQSFELRQMETRKKLWDEKLAKQKHLMQVLNDQITQRKTRENAEKVNDAVENEKISTYIAERDQRDLKEEIRLMKKHFGDNVCETVGVRNIKDRIAATENTGFVQETDTFTVNDTKHISETETEVKNHSAETEIDIPTPVDTTETKVIIKFTKAEINVPMTMSCNTDSELGESFVSTCDMNVNSQKITSPVSDTDVYSSCIQSFEDKFNPDNLKIRNPLPYNINLDQAMLDSSFFEQAATVLNNRNSLNNSSEDINDQTSFRHDSFFLNLFLNRSVTIPVGAQNRMVNSALLHYFIVEKCLFQHVEALNSYLCLQNGLFGHFLTNLLIQEVKNKGLTSKEDIPSKSGRLNEILGEAVALSAESSDRPDFRDNLGFILLREHNRNSMDLDVHQKAVKNKPIKSNYEVLDNITLNYSVEWPLSILLTDDLLINYEKLFTFLMRLYRAELLLLGLSSILKFKGGNSRQLAALHHYRYRMLHFVRSVRHYVNVTVIHCAWTDLASSFHKMNSLDRIYEGLVRHIKFVTTNCLLGTKGESVKKLLVDQLIVIECFCAEAEAYSQSLSSPGAEKTSDQRFANLDKIFKAWKQIQAVFVDVFFKLSSRGTYQKVSYFLQLFNFNGYFGSSTINTSSDP